MIVLAVVLSLFQFSFCDIPPVKDGDMELKLVQIVWRHGDRSPTNTFANDPFQEDAWNFGGGGFGQLSPLGMKQHIQLGKMLRNRYVNTGNSTYNFLPSIYDSKVIYVRSTGINRTLISAMSNMLGMYGQDGYGNAPGVDYPAVDGWPVGFVPVPIHTVEYNHDYIGNMDADCPRRDWLWGIAQQSDEFMAWLNSDSVSTTLANITKATNQVAPLEDLWIVPDALFIEQIYFNDTIRQKNSWFTDEFYQQIVDVNDQIYMYEYGIFNQTVVYKNLDVGLELLKTRAGSLMNEIVSHIDRKSDCSYKSNSTGSDCKWIDKLKYYAYSAHDETVYAVLVSLGIEKFAIIPHGYPLYSAAVAIEYWRNTSSSTDFFKLVYHKESGANFEVMTSHIDGCASDYCSLEVLRNYAIKIKPDQPIEKWCLVVDSSSSSTSFFIFWIFTLIFSMCTYI